MRATHCASGSTAYKPSEAGHGANALLVAVGDKEKSCASQGQHVASKFPVRWVCACHACAMQSASCGTKPSNLAPYQTASNGVSFNVVGAVCGNDSEFAGSPASKSLKRSAKAVAKTCVSVESVLMLGAKKVCLSKVCWLVRMFALAWLHPKKLACLQQPHAQRLAPCRWGCVPKPRRYLTEQRRNPIP